MHRPNPGQCCGLCSTTPNLTKQFGQHLFSLLDFCLDPLFHFYLFISCFFVVLFASFWERGSDNGNDDEGFVFLFSELVFFCFFLRICCTLELHCLPVSVEASYTGSMGRWQYIGRG